MLAIHAAVAKDGRFNFLGCRIPLPTNLNIPAWRHHTMDYDDKEVVDLLQFGFPLSFKGPAPTPTLQNHASASLHIQHVVDFTTKEVAEGAMLGPFPHPPIVPLQISPLLTRPKKDSTSRRCIMDLSFPKAPLHSVNSGTPTECYLDRPAKLHLPSPDTLAQLIKQAGRGCYIYSLDVARAFRQLPVCPSSMCCLGLTTPQGVFVDLSLPFGARWASYCCQRVTNVVSHVMRKRGALLCNYIDDFGGAATTQQQANKHFEQLKQLAEQLGLQLAPNKCKAPSTDLCFLGIQFNTQEMTMSIPPLKLKDIADLVATWATKSSANLHELRSLLGKLLHVANCSTPARLFLNRMLATLREAYNCQRVRLSTEFRKDIAWFQRYLPSTNGVFIIHPDTRPAEHVYVDSCMSGCGGCTSTAAYHAQYPDTLLDSQWSICHLEALNCLVALRMWTKELQGKRVHLHSDSATAVAVLQLGRGRSALLQTVAREIWLLCAQHDINLQVSHIAGAQLTASADALSRLHLGAPFSDRAQQFLSTSNITLSSVPSSLFHTSTDI
jgi:hypothetical protein